MNVGMLGTVNEREKERTRRIVQFIYAIKWTHLPQNDFNHVKCVAKELLDDNTKDQLHSPDTLNSNRSCRWPMWMER